MASFRVTEYTNAEASFLVGAVDELSRTKGGIVSQIQREPRAYVGTTQVTLDDGGTVELHSTEISAPITMSDEDVVAFRLDPLLESLDEAAEHHHAELTKYFLAGLETITEATGNQVDATGKSHFEYMYEMFEKIELSFEEDGSISQSTVMVAHPETAARMQEAEQEMTEDQRRQLDELLQRKREEYFARRRRRKLS